MTLSRVSDASVWIENAILESLLHIFAEWTGRPFSNDQRTHGGDGCCGSCPSEGILPKSWFSRGTAMSTDSSRGSRCVERSPAAFSHSDLATVASGRSVCVPEVWIAACWTALCSGSTATELTDRLRKTDE